MATIKSYTDIEQSKKLAKILPIESADMCYVSKDDRGIEFFEEPDVIDGTLEDVDIRCWSLAALLDVLPKHINKNNVLRIDISENDFSIWYDEIGYGVNNDLPNITIESAIDACYEMIIKLHKLNLM